jgi:hypothetical protein
MALLDAQFPDHLVLKECPVSAALSHRPRWVAALKEFVDRPGGWTAAVPVSDFPITMRGCLGTACAAEKFIRGVRFHRTRNLTLSRF